MIKSISSCGGDPSWLSDMNCTSADLIVNSEIYCAIAEDDSLTTICGDPGPYFPGWETFYQTIKHQIYRKHDIIFAIVHWLLIRKGFEGKGLVNTDKDHFLNLPIRPDFTELLPEGWNDLTNTCTWYQKYDVDYLLQRIVVEDVIVLRFISRKSQIMSYICFNTEYTISDSLESLLARKSGKLHVLVQGYVLFFQRVKKELLDPVVGSIDCRDMACQTLDYRSRKLFREEYMDISYNSDVYIRREPFLTNDVDEMIAVPKFTRHAPPGIRKLNCCNTCNH